MHSVILHPDRDSSLKRRHPWVFSGAIKSVEGSPKEGDWVSVVDSSNQILGYGHYHSGTIAVRMLHLIPAAPSDKFWVEKLAQAVEHRKSVSLPSSTTNAYRLIHAEGDGLSGLIIDIYNGVAVVQAHSVGMFNDRVNIADALQKVFKNELSAIYLKSPSTSKQSDEYLFGMSAIPHVIHEYDHRFYVDWETGQKTGFFLDQRENRKLLANFSRGKSVLNTFCYTGGFSIYALQAGASEVHSVDASEKAIELTRKNIELNGFDNQKHPSFAIDTFEFLKDKKEVYDVIILDPPAFAKHKSARHQAMKGYQRLNAEAMRIIRPGGIIFSFSCSQVVSRQLFYDTIVSAAIQAGREVKVLHQLSQPADHPISIYHPEGDYLKGLVLYIN